MAATGTWTDESSTGRHHQSSSFQHNSSCHIARQDSSAQDRFESVQIEASTGWVQLNCQVSDVATVQEEIDRVYRASLVSQLPEADRIKTVRFRFKPDVMRGDHKVSRLEVAGPEGFMIGFDQIK